MSDDRHRKLGLDDAYAVETPDDNRALYRDWADSYETDFVAARGYVYHQGVADLYVANRRSQGPVLDVGCGTGMAGTALAAHGVSPIDGIDLSPEMMARAAAKGVYRSLTECDVTGALPIPDDRYAGVVSVGTFTHGHLGPEPIAELVRVARPDAVFALGVNAEHYDSRGFGTFLGDLCDDGRIDDLRFEDVRIYTTADDDHADDLARVVLFRAR